MIKGTESCFKLNEFDALSTLHWFETIPISLSGPLFGLFHCCCNKVGIFGYERYHIMFLNVNKHD